MTTETKPEADIVERLLVTAAATITAQREEIAALKKALHQFDREVNALLSDAARHGEEPDLLLREWHTAIERAERAEEAFSIINATEAELTALKAERDTYRDTCKSVGVCMTCVIRGPESYGCTDCLNTGWDDGRPVGFVPKDELTTARKEMAAMREANLNVTTSLTAAISLLGRFIKQGAPSDKMFDMMLEDCRKSAERARATLKGQTDEA